MVRTWARALPVVVAIAAVATGAALGFGHAEPPVVPTQVVVASGSARAGVVSGTWRQKRATPTSYTVADAVGSTVPLYRSPGVPLVEKPALANPTWEGLPVVFLVLAQQGDWLHVRVSSRPNELTAYVAKRDVTLRTVHNHVLVEVGARRITVLHGDTVLVQAPVAVGTDHTPTPIGHFFVDGIVDVPNDGGPYGAFQVSVSGFSEVLQSFSGGVGQIALHGTNRPELLGQAVSNGCVRMANDTVTRLAELAPLGTPVQIVP